MENKLTWVELKKKVARNTNLTEKEVNLLLSIWLEEMTAALQRGEELRISGLGIFRLKTMKPRKSVDVTTGEAILLPETQRLTYTMAANMDAQLNNTTDTRLEVGVDPIQKLSNQADEIMDILGEMGQGPKADSRPDFVSAPVPSQPAPAVSTPAVPTTPTHKDPPPTKKSKGHLWLTAGITVLVFIILMIGLVFFFQYKVEQWLNNLREQAEMKEEIPDDLGDSKTIVMPADSDSSAIDSVLAVSEPTIETESVSNSSVRPQDYTEFIGTEEMHQDSRLAWMAYRYYGKKDLWVFIYDANKDHLTDPGYIPVGTPIRIPKLSEDLLQMATPEICETIRQMENEFLH